MFYPSSHLSRFLLLYTRSFIFFSKKHNNQNSSKSSDLVELPLSHAHYLSFSSSAHQSLFRSSNSHTPATSPSQSPLSPSSPLIQI
ncbi:unnamed protein product [Arabidopsis halleri]